VALKFDLLIKPNLKSIQHSGNYKSTGYFDGKFKITGNSNETKSKRDLQSMKLVLRFHFSIHEWQNYNDEIRLNQFTIKDEK
jgi:hypothetical protein